ncbi:hypothetical protein PVPAM_130008700 [Plasmodium vivax]|nr:hypothetical protein PVPAM_130008700 [Plasmodium vivax]
MAPFSLPEDVLSSDDLLTEKTDKEIREALNLDKLIEKTNSSDNESLIIASWMVDFEKTYKSYFTNIPQSWNTDKCNKRCRDLQYCIRNVKYYIEELKKNKKIDNNFLFKYILDYARDNYPKDGICKCDVDDKTVTEQMYVTKKLDDFCENRDFMLDNLGNKFNETDCIKYARYINSTRNTIIKTYLNNQYNPNDYNLNKNCSLLYITNTFPNIHCSGFLYYWDKILEIVPLKPVLMGGALLATIIFFSLIIRKCASNGSRKKKLRKKHVGDEQTVKFLKFPQGYIPEQFEGRNYHISYKNV